MVSSSPNCVLIKNIHKYVVTCIHIVLLCYSMPHKGCINQSFSSSKCNPVFNLKAQWIRSKWSHSAKNNLSRVSAVDYYFMGKSARLMNLLWCVDPDDVQVTVVNTLFVSVRVTRASLGSPPRFQNLAEITRSGF